MLTPNALPTLRRTLFGWKRFWCPLGAAIHCGDDGRGFLADPEGEYSSYLNPHVRVMCELLPEFGPLILCGDPGIGKTTEFKALKGTLGENSAVDPVFALSFRQHISSIQEFRQRTLESSIWNFWRDGKHRLTLMIDGIDEGLIRIPTFISALTGVLEDQPIHRLRLVLSCRSREWPHAQGSRLLELWPDTESQRPIYELCPLRYADVKLATESWQIDSEAFRQALMRSQAVGLATRPITLLFLLREFNTQQSLPHSHRELYHRGTRKLANEVDDERLELLRAVRGGSQVARIEERLTAAKRIAALILCCGRRGLRLEGAELDNTDENNVGISQCRSRTSTISSEAIGEVSESALFTSVGKDVVGFAHQTFAECLGSEELAELPLAQLRSLLMKRDDDGEHVVPQLIELAAWTAGRHREFATHLLEKDPVALLHGDGSVLESTVKVDLVEAILRGAESGKILDDFDLYRFFHTLKHPQLVSQLRPLIMDKTRHTGARSMALAIATRCELSELTTDLLSLVGDVDDPVRTNAAEAVCEIIPEGQLALIEPLALGQVGNDGQQALRSYALSRLIPRYWSVGQALPHIQAPSNTRVIGAYHRFFEGYLPDQLQVDDLVPCLNWLLSQTGWFDLLSSRNRFAKRIVHLAIEELSQKEVAEAFSRMWLDMAAQDRIPKLERSVHLNRLLAEKAHLKYELLSVILSSNWPEGTQIYTLFHEIESVSTPDVFGWLLEQDPTAIGAVPENWAAIVAFMSQTPSLLAPHWDRFLERVETMPVLTQQFQWRRAWRLDEALARNSKARWLRRKRIKARIMRRSNNEDETLPGPVREKALKSAASGDPEAWYNLWHVLHWGDEPYESDDLSRIQVEDFKGWHLLTDEQRQNAKRSARVFLEHHATVSAEWDANSDASLASTCAMWLLRAELESDLALAGLVSAHWIRLFSVEPYADLPASGELFSILNRLNHEASAATLFVRLERDRLRGSWSAGLRIAQQSWDERFNLALETFLKANPNPKATRCIMTEWMTLDEEAASRFVLQQTRAALLSVQDEAYPLLLNVLIVDAFLGRPVETFSLVQELLERDPHLAKHVWGSVLGDVGLRGNEWFSRWSEDQLANLYIHLLKALPRSGDPPDRDGRVSPRASAGWVRDRLPSQIASRATRAACLALQRLIANVPDSSPILQWHHRNALVQCRRDEWQPSSPEEVVRLLENSEARRIESERDLHDLILDSLTRYQRDLQDRTLPAVESLWNHLPIEGSRSRQPDPKDENVLSQEIARWLKNDLGRDRGVVVNCEVKPRRGSFTDIYVEAMRNDGVDGYQPLTVVIEVKGCWHRQVCTGMHRQLVDGYLRPNGLKSGIYLIGWFVCEAAPQVVNSTECRSIDETRIWLANELVGYNGESNREYVTGVVLDCSWPASAPSSQ